MKLRENVKLVIWDLDDTFWRGTLSEGAVERQEKNIAIVRTLIDRGIMCSVVSKNDFGKASAVLKDWGVYDLFIFPQISWKPKGEQITHLIKICSLRPQNVLFIDDSASNLREAEYYNGGIMTAFPNDIDDEFLTLPQLRGKNDSEHTRLKQYKALEARREIEEKFSSNEDFLRSSNITITISTDCTNNLARITELVQRTNQLNFTKIRSGMDELSELFSDSSCECAYVTARDDFGEYGIVGFYALKGGRLIHFVFSCRVLGFGIENYIYKKLGYPEISVIGEVTGQLDRTYAEKVDWIHEGAKKIEAPSLVPVKKERLLMISGCDLESACSYLESKFAVDKEFPTVIGGIERRTSETTQLVNALELSEKMKSELCREIPFFHEDITFATKLFSGNYSTVVMSVVDDYVRGTYVSNTAYNGGGGKFCIGYMGYWSQEESLKRFTYKQLEYLRKNFTYIGKEPPELFRQNLRKILDTLGRNVHVILINGIDVDISDWIGADRVNRNREMNAVVDDIVSEYSNADLLDMRKIVVSRRQLVKRDNRHFDRASYYAMAQEIARLCGGRVNVRNFTAVETGRFIMKVLRKIKRVPRKILRIILRITGKNPA